MDVGEIILDAIRYPSSDWKKIIILGVILIIPIVDFIGLGYVLRIVKSTISGVHDLPEFDDLGDLFVDGLKVLVVSIVYLIIPLIVLGLGVFGSLATFSGLVNITVVIGLILAILFGLFDIIALANMAFYDELGAAFKFREIFVRISEIGWGKYILWFIIMIIIWTIFGIIAGILNVIPYVGLIIAVIIFYSYFYMFGGRSTGLIYSSNLETRKTLSSLDASVKEASVTEVPEKPAD